MILLAPALISVLVGYLRRGRLAGLVSLRLRGVWCVLLAFALEASTGLLKGWFPDLFPRYMWAECLLQYGLLFAFILLNDKDWSIAVMGIGILLNFLVMILNGGRMPVSPAVLADPWNAGLIERIESGDIPEYVIMHGGEPLWFLGDVIRIPFRWAGYASIGDAVLAVGVSALIQKGMILGRPRHARGGNARSEKPRAVAADDGGGRAHTR
ncbi:MAG: DUF5317 domain-containing protein [Christensenellales bacterium]